MKKLKFAAGLLFLASACLVHALPVTTNAPQEYAGEDVHVVLSDTVAVPVGLFGGVFGVGIKVVYNSNVLTFKGGNPGTIHGDNIFDPLDPGVSLFGADPLDPSFPSSLITLDPAAYSFIVSLTYPFPDGANPGAGSLLDLVFTINSAALPGTMTDVDFSCDDFFGSCDYDFAPVSATVTVLQRNGAPLPLPGTLPLIGLGAAALLWARRRKH